jgi:hypothetical protein
MDDTAGLVQEALLVPSFVALEGTFGPSFEDPFDQVLVLHGPSCAHALASGAVSPGQAKAFVE